MGEGGAQRDGRRRFAGLSGLEKQGSKDGASAEQGSSFREGDRVTQTCSVRMGNGPNTLQTHTEVKWNSPGGFSFSVIMACTGSNLKVIRKTFHMNDRRCDT